MIWQVVIALVMIAPIAALVITAWVKWTQYVWSVRSDRTSPGREYWYSWLTLHALVLAIIGINLLRATLEEAL